MVRSGGTDVRVEPVLARVSQSKVIHVLGQVKGREARLDVIAYVEQ